MWKVWTATGGNVAGLNVFLAVGCTEALGLAEQADATRITVATRASAGWIEPYLRCIPISSPSLHDDRGRSSTLVDGSFAAAGCAR